MTKGASSDSDWASFNRRLRIWKSSEHFGAAGLPLVPDTLLAEALNRGQAGGKMAREADHGQILSLLDPKVLPSFSRARGRGVLWEVRLCGACKLEGCFQLTGFILLVRNRPKRERFPRQVKSLSPITPKPRSALALAFRNQSGVVLQTGLTFGLKASPAKPSIFAKNGEGFPPQTGKRSTPSQSR